MEAKLIERFFRYVSADTQSDPTSETVPSTASQSVFLEELKRELEAVGLSDAVLDERGYLTAVLPANSKKIIPSIGFIAHVDTSPDFSGKGVSPSIVKDYDGGDILLNAKKNVLLSPSDFPELKEYVGQDIIVTDGTTLLGADNKAGVAEIVTAMEYLANHPEIEHGRVAVAFTSDEEIGRGAALFDIEQFGCDWAYTVDGGALGELEYENFNAAEATVIFRGRNVHPGTAKGKMVNAVRLAMLFDAAIPGIERPETTEKYEGFYHLTSLSGSVEEATAHYIIRDHDLASFNRRKAFFENRAKEIETLYPGSISLLIKEQYRNMKEQIEPVMHVIEAAKTAMLKSGVVPVVQPIRGGTDGAVLSHKGLPCPNIFAGGMNFHGKYEYLPVFSMVKACEVIVNIVKEVAVLDR